MYSRQVSYTYTILNNCIRTPSVPVEAAASHHLSEARELLLHHPGENALVLVGRKTDAGVRYLSSMLWDDNIEEMIPFRAGSELTFRQKLDQASHT